jgi:toxin-antitoxin system PIN domain toxin
LIAVDTNILVYAHRGDAPWHGAAATVIARLASSPSPWAIPWPCIHEFVAVVTHSRIFQPPTPLELACEQIVAWLESPSLVLLAEDEGYWPEFRATVVASKVSGPRIHDARIAALCARHGVTELWSADRDFSRFASLVVFNPLLT